MRPFNSNPSIRTGSVTHLLDWKVRRAAGANLLLFARGPGPRVVPEDLSPPPAKSPASTHSLRFGTSVLGRMSEFVYESDTKIN